MTAEIIPLKRSGQHRQPYARCIQCRDARRELDHHGLCPVFADWDLKVRTLEQRQGQG